MSKSSRADAECGAATGQDLLPALERLDRLLKRAVTAAELAYGPEAATDRFRGLYISPDDAERLLTRTPAAPLAGMWKAERERFNNQESLAPSRLVWLAEAFGLTHFEMDVLLIAVAPELDLRYERLYAYLQDDVSRKLPSVDLVLNLLCDSTEAKLAGRAVFSSEGSLVRHAMLHLVADPNQIRPPLLAHFLKPDAQIVELLLGGRILDSRLTGFCELLSPDEFGAELPCWMEEIRALRSVASRAARDPKASNDIGPLRLYFQGPRGAGKRSAGRTLARDANAPLLIANLSRALPGDTDWSRMPQILIREAWLRDAVLYLDHFDSLAGDDHGAAYESLLSALRHAPGITILAGEKPWRSAPKALTDIRTVTFGVPALADRRSCWQHQLQAIGSEVPEDELDALADRFRLLPAQIAEAVQAAASTAGASDSRRVGARLAAEDLFAAARAHCGHELGAIARKVEPAYRWDDIVLPADALEQLHELCRRVEHRHRVLHEWGFGKRLSGGKGVNALFAGPSGTGKTMAAEIIANELRLDLYKIDLSGVMSKYIGETEKNLNRVFAAAESANAILFFDEADALFGKRSEVRDSHDRYANVEISYLLQKVEEYEGVAILASNLRQNLDEAFVRRLAFTVHFPFPDEADRRRVWEGVWPKQLPRAEDLDLDFLAREFPVSGGSIRNIALAAAYLAAEAGGSVTMAHLIQATRREYQKFGKSLGAVGVDARTNQAPA